MIKLDNETKAILFELRSETKRLIEEKDRKPKKYDPDKVYIKYMKRRRKDVYDMGRIEDLDSLADYQCHQAINLSDIRDAAEDDFRTRHCFDTYYNTTKYQLRFTAGNNDCWSPTLSSHKYTVKENPKPLRYPKTLILGDTEITNQKLKERIYRYYLSIASKTDALLLPKIQKAIKKHLGLRIVISDVDHITVKF